jgi:hypothetical protein
METLKSALQWATLAIADFEQNKLYGRIIIEFRGGDVFTAEKSVSQKAIGASTNGKPEYRSPNR